MNDESIFSDEYKSLESTEIRLEDQEGEEAKETETTTVRKLKTEKDKIGPDNPLYNIDKPRRVIIRAKAIHD